MAPFFAFPLSVYFLKIHQAKTLVNGFLGKSHRMFLFFKSGQTQMRKKDDNMRKPHSLRTGLHIYPRYYKGRVCVCATTILRRDWASKMWNRQGRGLWDRIEQKRGCWAANSYNRYRFQVYKTMLFFFDLGLLKLLHRLSTRPTIVELPGLQISKISCWTATKNKENLNSVSLFHQPMSITFPGIRGMS